MQAEEGNDHNNKNENSLHHQETVIVSESVQTIL